MASKIDREMVCRLKALIRETWPEEFNVKRAQLSVVQGGKGCAGSFPFVQDDPKDWTPSRLAFNADHSAIVEVLP